jgi:4-hydroxy-tetrahydrodipicolinate synthase
MFIGGSAGEGPLLTMREWTRMVQIAQDEAQGALPLLGGAIDTSTQRIKERIKIQADVGYEYFVVTPTFYTALKTPDEHLRLFGECAASSRGMSMIAYNIPSCTNSEIPMEVVCEIARRGWIKYCKESSGNLAYFKRLIAETTPLGLKVFMGDEASIAQGLQAGACGIVPVCANFEPQTFIRSYQAAQRQDWDEVARMQERIMVLREHLPHTAPCWIAGVKYAVAAMGIGSGRPVSPLQPLTAEQKQKLDEFVRQSH